MTEAFGVLRGFIDSATVNWLGEHADAAHRRREQSDGSPGEFRAEVRVEPRGRFVTTSSSFSLDAVLDDQRLGQLRVAFRAAVRRSAEAFTGRPLVLDVDQSWVRRQYAPSAAPPFHAAHTWHQDGALGYDFAAARRGIAATTDLLQMVTCWIALDVCGVDAPGLQFANGACTDLLAIASLNDGELERRFGRDAFVTPTLEPGDAVVFAGGAVHRTHVTPSMTRPRTSVELRLFPGHELPARLKGDRFMPWL